LSFAFTETLTGWFLCPCTIISLWVMTTPLSVLNVNSCRPGSDGECAAVESDVRSSPFILRRRRRAEARFVVDQRHIDGMSEASCV